MTKLWYLEFWLMNQLLNMTVLLLNPIQLLLVIIERVYIESKDPPGSFDFVYKKNERSQVMAICKKDYGRRILH